MQNIRKKLPLFLHDYTDVLDRAKAEELPPHRPYDHQIELTEGEQPPRTKALIPA